MTADLLALLAAPRPASLSSVARAFAAASESEGAVIFLSDGAELSVGAAHPEVGEPESGLIVALGQGLTGQVAQHGHALRVSADAPRTPAHREILGIGGGGVVARLLLPARGLDGEIHAVVAVHRPTRQRYADSDITDLQPFADLLGMRLQLRGLRDAVDAHHTERERLIGAAISAQEDERRRIAFDLHDGVTTALASMSFHLNAAELSIPSPAPGRSPSDTSTLDDARSQIAVARTLGDLAYAQTRAAISGLHSLVLADLGLVAAVESLGETAPGVQVDVTTDRPEAFTDLPDHLAAAVFRIAQETVANAARHAQAARIDVSLLRSEGSVVLRTIDDGVGFDVRGALETRHGTADDKVHFGLSSIAERCALVGASLRIDSVPGEGTTVTVDFPLPDR